VQNCTFRLRRWWNTTPASAWSPRLISSESTTRATLNRSLRPVSAVNPTKCTPRISILDSSFPGTRRSETSALQDPSRRDRREEWMDSRDYEEFVESLNESGAG